jgi:GNAT superfamily N-acetyltransferase
MDFDLTREIADQIIFAMEDQTEVSVVDGATGAVLAIRGHPERYPEPQYAPVPVWKPVDGYNLMEGFIAGLRNPVLREELRGALTGGKGVFRSFKDALRKSPEVERRWYLYKERAMRRVVFEWYNQMRELRGLERLSIEPPEESDDLEELIETDFVFAVGVDDRHEALRAADREAFSEAHADLPAASVATLYERRCDKYPPMTHADSHLMVAEDQAGQLAGFVWGVWHRSVFAPRPTLRVLQLWVGPAYRGIGLATTLVRRFLDLARLRGAKQVLVGLGASALGVRLLFTRERFEPVSELLAVELDPQAATEPPKPATGA